MMFIIKYTAKTKILKGSIALSKISKNTKSWTISVKFYTIDTDSDEDLAKAFFVNGIPEMNVIAAKNADGTYLYIDPYGKTTNDRKKSGIIGYTEAGPLRQVLDAALEARK